jgi:hypothetical protein
VESRPSGWARNRPAIVLGARFGKGGKTLRIGTSVYGAWHCVVGTFTLGLTASTAPAAIVMAAGRDEQDARDGALVPPVTPSPTCDVLPG